MGKQNYAKVCPTFELEWMNEKLAKHPERVAKMAEAKCPTIEKIAECHKACTPGDHECHHKCPKMHGRGDWYHGDWHHGDWHHGGRDGKIWQMMKEARQCHMKCGTDSDCHSKCPKPMAKFAKACEDYAAIKACKEKCKDADCDKCPKFDDDWMNKKLANNPERVARMVANKCPMIEKAHACHKACQAGDFQCHRKCHAGMPPMPMPRMGGGGRPFGKQGDVWVCSHSGE